MTNQFHKILNFMALFVTIIALLIGFFFTDFMKLASTNYIINGVILGVGTFGIGLCFYEMFRLLPEYRWFRDYTNGNPLAPLPPYILRQIALLLRQRPCRIYADTLTNMLDMVAMRFDTTRESIRYITNTLVLLGLLGTFWGLLVTLGGFGDLISGIDLNDTDVMAGIQNGLSGPLSGMATAFTSSLLGLGASIITGLLGHMVELAQNTIYTELGNYMAAHAHTATPEILPKIDLQSKKISATTAKTTDINV